MENLKLKTLQTYIVVNGDTLWKIANKFEVGIKEILIANPQINNPDLIYSGQQINIPNKPPQYQMEQEIIKLVNQERQKYGLPALSENWEVSRVARIKSEDMANNNYFSHTSPTYGTPFKMLKDFGIKYTAAGENIAYGQRNAQEVMNSWLNSSGHRANILNPIFNQIGVGIYKKGNNGPLYFTQIFIRS